VGKTGLGFVDHTDPTFTLLANVGFALVMFVVGTHVPVRNSALRSSIPKALVRAVLVGAAAAVLGVVLAAIFHTGHAAVYAVLMASSSAALALPVMGSLGLDGPPVLSVTAQIAIADAASIVLLPLVIDPSRAVRAALGGLAIAACAFVLFLVLRSGDRLGWRKRVHRYSQKHGLALELRFSLLILFVLCALATTTHVSIMLAGFALGLVIAAVGPPRRLARQLFGITDGFFGPLFFVWLGASLDLRALGTDPRLVGLGVCLGLGAALVHLVWSLVGQPVPLALLASAQLGVPVAAATIGVQLRVLTAAESSAVLLGAVVTIVVVVVAANFARRPPQPEPVADQAPPP
jgi:Kef-type K+ transport system membrane component KefB